MKKLRVIIAAALAVVSSTAAAYAEELIIGILEQSQTALCSGEKPMPAVRPLFGKSKEKWMALKSKKTIKEFNIKSVSWTAAFDGKNIGQVTSVEPKKEIADDWTYPRDHQQTITSRNGEVEIKNSKEAFVGWCGAPKVRPIVLVSRPNYEDPDGWKPFKPDASIRQKLFREFRKSVGKAPLCYIKDDNYFPFKYDVKNLKLLKSYKSSQGELIQATLDREYTQCDDELGEGNSPHWFTVKDDIVRYIGDGMELVDAGDYDADGNSEILFWYSGYNKNGYVLLYDELQKKVEFLWTYH